MHAGVRGPGPRPRPLGHVAGLDPHLDLGASRLMAAVRGARGAPKTPLVFAYADLANFRLDDAAAPPTLAFDVAWPAARPLAHHLPERDRPPRGAGAAVAVAFELHGDPEAVAVAVDRLSGIETRLSLQDDVTSKKSSNTVHGLRGAGRGAAAGRDVDTPWRRVAATPRVSRG